MGNIDPQFLIMHVVAVVLGVTIHEFSHAFVAYRLGDPTAAELAPSSRPSWAGMAKIEASSRLLSGPANVALMILIILPWAASQLGMFNLDINVLGAMVGPLIQLFQRLLLPVGGCCHAVHFDPDGAEAA